MRPNKYRGILIALLNIGTIARKMLIILLLSLTTVPTMVSGYSAEPLELVVEVRLTRRGKVTKVEIRTEPTLSQEGTIYFETSEKPGQLERIQLHAQQAHIRGIMPSRFISSAFAYSAKYRIEKHQKLDRVILEASGYVLPITLKGDVADGVSKLVVAVSGDQDGDGAFAEARILNKSRILQFCPDYDSNPLAHPLQTAFFYQDRGDLSADWNCNGKINLASVDIGKPGMYELQNGVCVEVVPPVPGWVKTVPTEVGMIAHCYIRLPDTNSSISWTRAIDSDPQCPQPDTLCTQGGN